MVSTARRLFRWYSVQRDRHLSWEGKYVLLAGIFVGLMGLDVQGTSVYLLWCLFFGVFFASMLVKWTYRFPVMVERKAARTASAGVPFTYPVSVRNLSARPLEDLVVREEDLPPGVAHAHYRGLVGHIDRIEPGREATAVVTLVFERRGVYDLRATRVERLCPLGLTRSGRSFESPGTVVVYPEWRPVQEVYLPSATMHQPGGVPMASSVGESTEFIGLREYRPGDQVKHISWKAWARLGRPAVREFQAEYFKRVILILDAHTNVFPGAVDDDFEAAVSVCASLAHYFDENEYVIDLFAAGSRLYYLQAGRGLATLNSILEILAMVEASPKECLPKVDRGMRELLGRVSGLVLVCSDWTERLTAFHERVRGLVPFFKPVVVKTGSPSIDPASVVDHPEAVTVIEAGSLQEGLVRI